MSTDQLLDAMQAVLRDAHGRRWCARAVGCFQWGYGPTPVAAMQAALAVRDGAATPDEPNADLF